MNGWKKETLFRFVYAITKHGTPKDPGEISEFSVEVIGEALQFDAIGIFVELFDARDTVFDRSFGDG